MRAVKTQKPGLDTGLKAPLEGAAGKYGGVLGVRNRVSVKRAGVEPGSRSLIESCCVVKFAQLPKPLFRFPGIRTGRVDVP